MTYEFYYTAKKIAELVRLILLAKGRIGRGMLYNVCLYQGEDLLKSIRGGRRLLFTKITQLSYGDSAKGESIK